MADSMLSPLAVQLDKALTVARTRSLTSGKKLVIVENIFDSSSHLSRH